MQDRSDILRLKLLIELSRHLFCFVAELPQNIVVHNMSVDFRFLYVRRMKSLEPGIRVEGYRSKLFLVRDFEIIASPWGFHFNKVPSSFLMIVWVNCDCVRQTLTICGRVNTLIDIITAHHFRFRQILSYREFFEALYEMIDILSSTGRMYFFLFPMTLIGMTHVRTRVSMVMNLIIAPTEWA